MKRTLSALLAAALLTSLLLTAAACGEQKPSAPPADGTVGTTAADIPQTEAAATAYNGLTDIDFGGITVSIFNNPYHETEVTLLSASEQNGDVINDTVYARSNEVMTTLNVDLVYYDEPTSAKKSKIVEAVSAGDDIYTIISSSQNIILSLALGDYLQNILNAPYIDLDADWWASDYIDAINIGLRKRYFVSGDIAVSMLRYLTCTFVNRSAWENQFGSADALYTTVLDGGWTFDYIDKTTRDAWQDLNGNGTADIGDFFAFLYNDAATVDSLYLNSGATYSHRDADNIPVIDPANELSLRAWSRIYQMTVGNARTVSITKDNCIQQFGEGNSLMLFGWFYVCDNLRAMESDYLLLPSPKLDESVENYKSNVHNATVVFCLPITTTDLEPASAVMEEMAFLGWRDLSPAYYEIAMKGKYMRDSGDEAMRVVDLIHDSMTTDTVFAFSDQLADLGRAHRKICTEKLESPTSYFDSVSAKVSAGLETLITAYTD